MIKPPVRSEHHSAERSAGSQTGAPKSRDRFAGRSGLKKVTTGLEPEIHTQLKIISAQSGRTIEDLLRDAVTDLIAKHNADPSVASQ